MFLITVRFRRSRSKRNSEKQGVVFYRITGHGSLNDEPRLNRCVNSDIHGADESVLLSEREKIISQLRLIYCIIERREDSATPFSTDDVANDFRKALASEPSMKDVIAKSETDFPIRNDIVSIGREFRDAFRYVFAVRANGHNDNLFDYIFNLIQSRKNERRISQARNFLSLLSNLHYFTENKDVKFSEIDAKFIIDYAEWLKHTGIAESTQSFYLRTFRSILNTAHGDGLISVPSDWFAKVNTKISRSSDTADRKLSRDLLLQIENTNLSSSKSLALARDMFMFGFYCGGMELIDIANLTDTNIKKDFLVYRRRLKGQEKSVALGAQAQEILKRYGRDRQRYLFPLLDKSGDVMFSTVRNQVSQCMKTIGKIIGCPRLTFSMNIGAYKSLVSGVCISEILLRHNDVV